MTFASKSYCLFSIVKKCLHTLLLIITKILDLSCESARVQGCYKTAAIIPLLKTIFLCPEVLSNLRPISTLPFVSKRMKRVAGKRLGGYKEKNKKLNEKMQSSYREGHSCETALMHIKNDILVAIDSKKCVFLKLVLLDMQSVFDTVDYELLLKRLSDRFGIQGKASEWIVQETVCYSGRHQICRTLPQQCPAWTGPRSWTFLPL